MSVVKEILLLHVSLSFPSNQYVVSDNPSPPSSSLTYKLNAHNSISSDKDIIT